MRTARPWTVCLCIVLLSFAWARGRSVLGAVPYSMHVDEVHLTQPAVRMLTTGDLNPHFFRYPSLPIYLTALSMKAGAIGSSSDPKGWKIPPKGGPYQPTGPYAAARLVFAALSIVTAGLVGALGRLAFGSNPLLLIAPLFLAMSGVYQYSAAVYLNVDVVATAFVLAALVQSFASWGRHSAWAAAVLPGALGGMAIASKYTAGVVLLPCALAIVLGGGERRLRNLTVLLLASAVAFFVCVPYAAIDPKHFIADVKWEMNHYRGGHARFEGPTGLPQLIFYWKEIRNDFGAVAVSLAGLGLASGLVRDLRRTVTLFVGPAVLLLYMTTNRVHFVRTVLPVFVLLPVFEAEGVLAIGRVASWLGSRLGARAPSWLPAALGGALATAAFALAGRSMNHQAPLDRTLAPDPRNVAARWLESQSQSSPAGSPMPLLIAPELHMALDRVAGFRVRVLSPGLSDAEQVSRELGGSRQFLLVPRFGTMPRRRVVGGQRTVLGTPWSNPVQDVLPGVKLKSVLNLDGDPTPMGSGRYLPEPVRRPGLIIHEVLL